MNHPGINSPAMNCLSAERTAQFRKARQGRHERQPRLGHKQLTQNNAIVIFGSCFCFRLLFLFNARNGCSDLAVTQRIFRERGLLLLALYCVTQRFFGRNEGRFAAGFFRGGNFWRRETFRNIETERFAWRRLSAQRRSWSMLDEPVILLFLFIGIACCTTYGSTSEMFNVSENYCNLTEYTICKVECQNPNVLKPNSAKIRTRLKSEHCLKV